MNDNQIEKYLAPVVSSDGLTLDLKNFELLKASAEAEVENDYSHFLSPITSDDVYKAAKKERAAVNKKKDLVKDARLKVSKAFIGTWEEKCKTLEKIFADSADAHKKVIDEWEKEHQIGRFKPKPDQPKTYSFVATFLNEEDLKKAAEYLEKKLHAKVDLMVNLNV